MVEVISGGTPPPGTCDVVSSSINVSPPSSSTPLTSHTTSFTPTAHSISARVALSSRSSRFS